MYKRQHRGTIHDHIDRHSQRVIQYGLALFFDFGIVGAISRHSWPCLLYTSDAADERSSVDLGGRRIIKKKKNESTVSRQGVKPHKR